MSNNSSNNNNHIEKKEDYETLCKNIKVLQNLLSQRTEQLELVYRENERLRGEVDHHQHIVETLQANDSTQEIQMLERQLGQLVDVNTRLKSKMKSVKNALQDIINDSALPSPMRQKVVLLLPLLLTTNEDVSSLITPSRTSSIAPNESGHSGEIEEENLALIRTHSSPMLLSRTTAASDGIDMLMLDEDHINIEECEEEPETNRASSEVNLFKSRNISADMTDKFNHMNHESSPQPKEDVSGTRLSVKQNNQKKKQTSSNKKSQNSNHNHVDSLEIDDAASTATHIARSITSPIALQSSEGASPDPPHPSVLSFTHSPKSRKSTSPVVPSPRRRPNPPERRPPPPTRRIEHYKALTTSTMVQPIISDKNGETSIHGTKSSSKTKEKRHSKSNANGLSKSNGATPISMELKLDEFTEPMDSSENINNHGTRFVKRSGSSGAMVTSKDEKSELKTKHNNAKIRSVSANVEIFQEKLEENMVNNSRDSSTRGSKETRVWTLADLVLDVTSATSHDMQKSLSALILCHKAFTDSISLMKQLRQQFRDGDRLQDLQLEKTNEQENESKHWLVRVRVCNVVRFWIKHYWEEDFLTQEGLQIEIWNLKQDIDQTCEPQKAQTLKEKIDVTVQGVNNGKLPVSQISKENSSNISIHSNGTAVTKLKSETKLIVDGESPVPKSPVPDEDKEEKYDQVHMRWPHLERYNIAIPPGMELMLLDPDDIAQQLTLMDFHLFREIKARECIGQSWKKKDKWRLAPNVLRMIAQFNSVSKWTQLTVLGGKTPKERSNLIKKIITMMKSLQKHRNFSSFCACHAGLNSDDIRRLKQSWEKLPRPSRKEWDEINDFFDWRMTKLKQLQEQCIAPAVPHIGLYLQVLFNIDEGTRDTSTETGGVNYVKMMMLNDQIERLMQYQQGKYEITELPQIQKLVYQEFSTQYKMVEKHITKLADIVKATEVEK